MKNQPTVLLLLAVYAPVAACFSSSIGSRNLAAPDGAMMGALVGPQTRSSTQLFATEQPRDNAETTSETTASSISSTCWNPKLRQAMGALAAAGSLETGYLTFTKLTTGSAGQILCSLNSAGGSSSCTDVLNGPYAVVPGTEIPLTAVGLVAYTTMAALALGPLLSSDKDDSQNRILLTALATSMGVFSVFLMTILTAVLHQSCPYCTASAVFSVAMAAISWLGGALPSAQPKARIGVLSAMGGGVASFLAAVVLFVSNYISDPSSVDQSTVAGESVGSFSATSTLLASTASTGQAPPEISTTSSPRALALADNLQALDTRFFGAFWCGHCFDQKQELGRQAMARIPYIECSRDGLNSQTALCKETNVPGYPTWQINGQLYPGQQDLSELEEIVRQQQQQRQAAQK